MSGGSMNYAYRQVEEAESSISAFNPRRVAFKKLLLKVAQALHDIEWVDSGDCGPGDEDHAIDACLKFDVQQSLIDHFQAEVDKLQEYVKQLQKMKEAP